jgi:hypothetical protein
MYSYTGEFNQRAKRKAEQKSDVCMYTFLKSSGENLEPIVFFFYHTIKKFTVQYVVQKEKVNYN